MGMIMRYLGLLVLDQPAERPEIDELMQLGFRRRLATDDKSFAFQLPYPGWAIEREGDSPEQIRDEILANLSEKNISAFVIVAQCFSCGRT
jgi:hypothetical protein